MAKRPDYRIIAGFTHKHKTGKEAKGPAIRYGPGEPIPDEILDDTDMLNTYLGRNVIARVGAGGEVVETKRKTRLSSSEIEMIVAQKSLKAVQAACKNANVAKESLSELYTALQNANAPADLLKCVERAIETR